MCDPMYLDARQPTRSKTMSEPPVLVEMLSRATTVKIERLEVAVAALRRIVCDDCRAGHPLRSDGRHQVCNQETVHWSCPASDAINEAMADRTNGRPSET